MKPTRQDFENAVAAMTILRFFPSEPIARAMIMDLLSRMVSTKQQLEWLVRVMVDKVGEWRGPAELRALLCTRFRPADGIEGPACTISGYTPADNEAAYITEAAERYLLPVAASRDEAFEQDQLDAIRELQERVDRQIATLPPRVQRRTSGTPEWLKHI